MKIIFVILAIVGVCALMMKYIPSAFTNGIMIDNNYHISYALLGMVVFGFAGMRFLKS